MPAPPASPDGPKPEETRPKPEEVELRDLGIRLAGIPFFGIVIPNLTGLFGPLGPREPAYWLGYAWFVLLSGLIWQGNRFFLVQQRRHYDWFRHPWLKVSLLLFANVFWTAPLTVAMLVAWYRFSPLGGVDWPAVRVVALANVVCVVFITHVYETVYLIQQREDDLVAVARLDRARAEAELLALKSQVDPHFLFNSLAALAHLIPRDPRRAVAFTEGLAETYRYILANRQRDLVPLAEEMRFLEAYGELLRLRFGDAVRVSGDGLGDIEGFLVPPISLQVLLENAVKHNAFGPRAPLEVRVRREGDRLLVANGRRAKSSARPSPRVGLRNLDERCRRITGRGLEIHSDEGTFRVSLPLLRAAA
jgi:sensor histidine kinase YesM